jgi:hypothetical protein
MPSTVVAVPHRVGDLRQSTVRLKAQLKGCGAVDGGADEGMPEVHAPAELDQVGCLGRCRGMPVESEELGRRPQQPWIPGGLGCRYRQQGLSVGGQLAQTLGERELEVFREGHVR